MKLLMNVKDVGQKNQKSRQLKVYDLIKQKEQTSTTVVDPKIIGRFTSGLFILVDGHFYFNNEVIKVRYDQIRKAKFKQVDQITLFDHYDNILDLKANEQIQANYPILSIQNHRQVYLTRNPDSHKPFKLIILPYLHERKIYLNPMKPRNNYFYTALEDLKVTATDSATTLMIAMDLTASKYFLYSEGGLLQHRVNFEAVTKVYGKPVQVSPNGKIFLFKKDGAPSVIHIFALTFEEFVFIKTIDLQERIRVVALQ